MTLDRKVREAMQAEAATVEPDVDRQLDEVIERSGRRSGPLGALAVATTAVLAIAILMRLWPADPLAVFQSPQSTPVESPSPSEGAEPLVGTYRAAFVGGDTDALGLAGEWTLTFGADSTLAASGPDAFASALADRSDDDLYALRDDELFVSLFARDLDRECVASGSYHWRLADGHLMLDVDADPCAPRVALLTSQSWERLR